MKNLQRKVRSGIVILSVLIFLIFIISAYAATFINQLNTPNGAPLNTNPYQFFVCSDSSFGEGPAIEYSVNGGPFTCNPCSFYTGSSTKCPGASVFQCTIPRQTNATVQYQFFNLSTFGDCNSSRSLFTGFKSFTTDINGNTTPTEARMHSFKATAGKGGVLLEWRTGFEVDNLGFNLYREADGARTQVNPSIIAGSALTAGAGTPLTAGHVYHWRDPQGNSGAQYYLESVDLNGTTVMNGPVSPVPGIVTTKEQQATLLTSLGSNAGGQTTQREGPTTLMSSSPSSSSSASSATQPSAESLQEQWAIASQPAVKILVRKDDWYRVGQPDLLAAGLDPSADPQNLHLFVDGTEQPMMVLSNGSQMSTGDFIEFYGTGLDTTETDTHVYWLVAGNTPGKRIKLIGNERPDSIKDKGYPIKYRPLKSPILGGGSVGEPVGESRGEPRGETTGSFLWRVMRIFDNQVEDAAASVSTSHDQKKEGDSQDRKSEAESAAQGEPPAAQTEPPPTLAAPPVQAAPPAEALEATKSATVRNEEQPKVRTRVVPRAKGRPTRRRRATGKRELAHYSPAAAGAGEAQSFSYTFEAKPRSIYFSSLLNGETENFFGPVVASLPVTQTLNVSHPDTAAQGPAILEVAIQGVSAHVHDIRILFNDTEVGTTSSPNFYHDHMVATLPLSPALVHEGSNTVKLITSATGGVSLLDYVRLTYAHTYQADNNNTLRFSLKSSQTVRVEGFTTSHIRVIDVSDPQDIQQVRPAIEPSGSGYAIIIGTPGRSTKGRRTLLAFPDSQFSQPASLVANQPSSLNRTDQGADMLIISHRSLLGSVATLANLRRSQGLSVSVLDVEDVFDEFGYGTHDVRAIKNFLSYTSTHWATAPRFVLLAGDASFDAKNYLGLGNFDLVPARLVDTLFTETSSDDWVADFDGDAAPDMAVGRLPARTPAEMDVMVSKIVNYSPGAANKSALFVADTNVGTPPFLAFDFEGDNRTAAAKLPASISVQFLDKGQTPINTVRAQLFNAINQGPMIVNYAGHGTVDAWTGSSLFTDPDAYSLSNGTNNANHLPFFVMMTCLTGYFNDPGLDSLSESLMKAPNGGSVAVWASSGLTVPTGQSLMDQSLYQSLFTDPSPTIGEAIRKAKLATQDTDVRLTWTLFGDPSMKLR